MLKMIKIQYTVEPVPEVTSDYRSSCEQRARPSFKKPAINYQKKCPPNEVHLWKKASFFLFSMGWTSLTG